MILPTNEAFGTIIPITIAELKETYYEKARIIINCRCCIFLLD